MPNRNPINRFKVKPGDYVRVTRGFGRTGPGSTEFGRLLIDGVYRVASTSGRGAAKTGLIGIEGYNDGIPQFGYEWFEPVASRTHALTAHEVAIIHEQGEPSRVPGSTARWITTSKAITAFQQILDEREGPRAHVRPAGPWRPDRPRRGRRRGRAVCSLQPSDRLGVRQRRGPLRRLVRRRARHRGLHPRSGRLRPLPLTPRGLITMFRIDTGGLHGLVIAFITTDEDGQAR